MRIFPFHFTQSIYHSGWILRICKTISPAEPAKTRGRLPRRDPVGDVNITQRESSNYANRPAMSDIIRLHQSRSRPFIWRPELSGYLAAPHEFRERVGRRVSCIRASSLPVRVKVRACARVRDHPATVNTRHVTTSDALLCVEVKSISRTSAMEKRRTRRANERGGFISEEKRRMSLSEIVFV